MSETPVEGAVARAELPAWAGEMRELFRSGSVAQFLLHGNVFDVVQLCHGERERLLPLRAFLDDVMFDGWDVVLHYDRSRGIRASRGGDDFARFLDDGRICLTNNAAERALRGIALGRRNWTFAGSQRGADRAAFMLTLITTARLNDVDPKAWLADVLARIADLPASRLHEMLPWEWKRLREVDVPANQQAA